MGMFDTVAIKCPHCRQVTVEQSKGGACVLACYGLDDVPFEVLRGIDNPVTCSNCKREFSIVVDDDGDEVVIKMYKNGFGKRRRIVVVDDASG